MSDIDMYRHEVLGYVTCPSRFRIVGGNDTRIVALYVLLEDASEEDGGFEAKQGDILLGGGNGEGGAFRVSMPEAILQYTHDDHVMDDLERDAHQAYWSMSGAFILCDGYERLGWEPTVEIEWWLTQHILSFLVKAYPERYLHLLGSEPLELDGSICRKTLDPA